MAPLTDKQVLDSLRALSADGYFPTAQLLKNCTPSMDQTISRATGNAAATGWKVFRYALKLYPNLRVARIMAGIEFPLNKKETIAALKARRRKFYPDVSLDLLKEYPQKYSQTVNDAINAQWDVSSVDVHAAAYFHFEEEDAALDADNMDPDWRLRKPVLGKAEILKLLNELESHYELNSAALQRHYGEKEKAFMANVLGLLQSRPQVFTMPPSKLLEAGMRLFLPHGFLLTKFVFDLAESAPDKAFTLRFKGPI